MQDPNEIEKINDFLSQAAPFVISQVKMLFESLGLEIKEEGSGADLAFLIKSGKTKLKFLPYNMMLDIASIDRKATPLKFDQNVWDLSFFLAKTGHVVETRMRFIFQMLTANNTDEAVERVCRLIKSGEEVHIWELDPENTAPASPQQHNIENKQHGKEKEK